MGGTDITNDGCIGPKSAAFYELRAKGGAAAAYTTDAIRRRGAMPSLELSHSGMYAGTYMTDKGRQKGMNQWGSSDTVRQDGVQVRALSKDQIIKGQMSMAVRWKTDAALP